VRQLRDEMQADLTAAMRTGDRRKVSVLRSALAALANAEAVVAPVQKSTPVAFGTTEVPRRELADADERGVLDRELDELRTTADQLRHHGRESEAADLDARAAILAAYLK
jgi:hypothetical protein